MKAAITVTREHVIELDAHEIAAAWCDMNVEEQARFFNEVARLSSEWKAPLCYQLQGITDWPELSPAGRAVMKQIGEYSEVQS